MDEPNHPVYALSVPAPQIALTVMVGIIVASVVTGSWASSWLGWWESKDP